ncbi:MAG: hypothetical protein N4J56_002514 [Chroococcidiopsis sp. SAG 2025]|nr:hypothetical protein [Chroococcidiopsis sp. SAG 2025]
MVGACKVAAVLRLRAELEDLFIYVLRNADTRRAAIISIVDEMHTLALSRLPQINPPATHLSITL